MIQEALSRLAVIIATLPARLEQFTEEDFSYKRQPGKWSKKEILGHLIDSASNNHHRFIRAQYEQTPLIVYDQDVWVKENNYIALDTATLIAFWSLFNTHILGIIGNMPAEKLAKHCSQPDGTLVDLNYLFNDYVCHLDHHIKQLFED